MKLRSLMKKHLIAKNITSMTKPTIAPQATPSRSKPLNKELATSATLSEEPRIIDAQETLPIYSMIMFFAFSARPGAIFSIILNTIYLQAKLS